MLQPMGRFNHLSDQLRDELQRRADQAGRFVTYRFDIARKNPDGERKTGGEWLYPSNWVLTPKIFDIIDPYNKRRISIAMPITVKDDKGNGEDRVRSIQIREGWEGKYMLDLNKPDDRDAFGFLELHPKLSGGTFADPQAPGLIRRVDVTREAKRRVSTRNEKANALLVSTTMDDVQVKDFAAAMGWDETEDIGVLRDRMQDIAENDHKFFTEFLDNKNFQHRAVIKRAMDNKIIEFHPVENKFVWASNKQIICVLERAEGDKVLDRMSDWLVTAKNGPEVFQQITKMLNKKEKATTS